MRYYFNEETKHLISENFNGDDEHLTSQGFEKIKKAVYDELSATFDEEYDAEVNKLNNDFLESQAQAIADAKALGWTDAMIAQTFGGK